ncbi:MAG: hypothetical protein KAX54_00335 [Thauera sp.]|nr:hypothetical protein [Thauera sp.]
MPRWSPDIVLSSDRARDERDLAILAALDEGFTGAEVAAIFGVKGGYPTAMRNRVERALWDSESPTHARKGRRRA